MVMLISLLSGLLFGLGLALSGMTNPANVLGFLDVMHWNPSLVFVMLGALSVFSPGYWLLVHNRKKSLCGESFQFTQQTKIDRRLLGGATLFGIGWGMAGLCPGPALALLSTAQPASAIFIAALAGGALTVDHLFPAR